MDVLLVTEGTYPQAHGGVSVWCDQMIRGLDRHRFHLVTLCATGREPAVWDLPENVAAVHTVPLWGPRAAARRRPNSPAPPDVGIVVDLLEAVLSHDPGAPERFETALYKLHQGAGLAEALRTEEVIEALTDLWLVFREPGWPTLQLADAMAALDLIEHTLRPLTYRPPRADVTHVVSNGPAVLVGLVAKWQHGTPFVLAEHGVYLRERYLALRAARLAWPVMAIVAAFTRRLCEVGYRGADLITPCNEYNQRWERRLGADATRLRTVYNGVDPARFAAIPDEPSEPTLVFVGRIDPLKDLITLIEGFALVRAALPTARLRIFGAAPDGGESYETACVDLVARLGLVEAVGFEGQCRAVREAYAAGHVVVLSSISEGLPFTVLEAMTCGRPTVGTDVGGVGEAIGDAGLVVPPRNPAELAAACVALLTDHDRRRELGRSARERALELFTIARVAEAFDDVYESVAASAAQASQGMALEPVTYADGGLAGGAPLIAAAGAADAVGELAAEMSDLCRGAVDVLAVVAGLEAAGYSDRTARERYGAADLFALAAELYRRVPRAPGPPPDSGIPRTPMAALRAVTRGLLFAAPTFDAFAALVSVFSGVGRAALVALQVLAWGYGQGVAHLAYGRLGTGEPAAARRILRVGTWRALLAASSMLTAVDLLRAAPSLDLVAPTFGFCLAAIPALVLGAEFRLAAAWLPTGLAVIASRLGAPAVVPVAAATLSVLLAVALTFHLTRTANPGAARAGAAARVGVVARVGHGVRLRRPAARAGARTAAQAAETRAARGRRLVTRSDLRAASPHVLAGLGTGALFTLVLAGAASGSVASHVAVALSLSVGTGEWHAGWYQVRVARLLAVLGRSADFTRRSIRLMIAALLRQTATGAALAAVGYALDRSAPGAPMLYLYAAATTPGLLATLFLRSVDAVAVLAPVALTLTGAAIAVSTRHVLLLPAIALAGTVLLAIRATRVTARPWAHL